MSAKSPNGPWVDADSPQWWNPAPWVSANGSVTVVYASDYMHVSTAPSWQGPYTSDNKPLFSVKNEDAFLWQDPRGNFHLLMHGMQPYGPFGRHAYSHTGAAGSWTFSPTMAYDNHIQYVDGSVKTPARRERPHVLFNEAGEPTHLYTSIQDQWGGKQALHDHTYTHVQSIRTANRG